MRIRDPVVKNDDMAHSLPVRQGLQKTFHNRNFVFWTFKHFNAQVNLFTSR